MAAEEGNTVPSTTPQATRLFSTYLKAQDELQTDAVMLWEVIGNEIQSVALRVASDAMKRLEARE